MNLSGANLREADLTDSDLTAANVDRADFRDAIITANQVRSAVNWQLAYFSDPMLQQLGLPEWQTAQLDTNSFDGRDFGQAELGSANLHNASLRGAHLEHVRGLQARQLLATDVTGAHLPEPIKKFEALKSVEKATKAASTIWATTTAACLYCWITAPTTTDADLFGADHQTTLPFVQAKISAPAFYVAATLILLVMFFYLQFSLQVLWEAFASLPAIFEDGHPLHERAAPFFLSSIVRLQFDRLERDFPGLARSQAKLARLLGWWIVPITLILLWARFLVARRQWMSETQAFAIACSIAASVYFWGIAASTLRGEPPRKGRGRLIGSALLGSAVFLLIGGLSGEWISGSWYVQGKNSVGMPAYTTRVPDLLNWLMTPNLFHAKISEEGGETEKNERAGIRFKGPDLHGRSLWHCRCAGVALVSSDLWSVDLTEADLRGADLRNSDLNHAILTKASLEYADLRGAHFELATFLDRLPDSGARFDGADLQNATFGFSGPDAEAMKGIKLTANNWVLARWGGVVDTGLPTGHNSRIDAKNLSGYQLSELGAHQMKYADLVGWNLRCADFSGVELEETNFSHADLRRARFDAAQIQNAAFDHADLRYADLRKALGLTQSQVDQAITDRTTKLPPGLLSAEKKSK